MEFYLMVWRSFPLHSTFSTVILAAPANCDKSHRFP
jgi:hypothetical protein